MRYARAEIDEMAERIREEGFAVLESGLPREALGAMRERFDELLAVKAGSDPVNRGPERYQMYLPWEAPLSDPALYEDDDVLALVEAVMEPDPALVYFASDTPLPGSDYQRCHSDTRLLYPELDAVPPCYGLVLNVPLVDCSEENGSLEFWPGTHLLTGGVDLARLPAGTPSRRANLKAGSMLVRDLRMWHRGTPNRSSRSRPHLALVYARPWFRFNQEPPVLSAAAFEGLSDRGKRLLRFATVRS